MPKFTQTWQRRRSIKKPGSRGRNNVADGRIRGSNNYSTKSRGEVIRLRNEGAYCQSRGVRASSLRTPIKVNDVFEYRPPPSGSTAPRPPRGACFIQVSKCAGENMTLRFGARFGFISAPRRRNVGDYCPFKTSCSSARFKCAAAWVAVSTCLYALQSSSKNVFTHGLLSLIEISCSGMLFRLADRPTESLRGSTQVYFMRWFLRKRVSLACFDLGMWRVSREEGRFLLSDFLFFLSFFFFKDVQRSTQQAFVVKLRRKKSKNKTHE